MSDTGPDMTTQKNNLALASVGVLALFLLIVGGAYLWVSNKNKGGVVFPAGVNYLGPQTTTNLTPVPTLDLTQIGQSGKWLQSSGKIYKYTFIYPAELQVTAFINDPTDKIAWLTGITPPQQNVVFNVETMSNLGAQYEGKAGDFAQNFWRKFNGLAGAKNFAPFKNAKGLEGYKVEYVDKSGKTVNTNYFFPVPSDSNHVLQVINGILPADIFDKIVNGVEFKK